MRVYIAGPLFTPDEQHRLEEVAAAVETTGHTPVLPYDPEEGPLAGSREGAYQRCVDALRTVDAVVAVLDGVDVDSGTAFEVGMARARDLPVLGLRTDHRTLGEEGVVNLMLHLGVSRLLRLADWSELPEELASFLRDPPGSGGRRLVRDRVPALRRKAGEDVEVERVEGEAYVTELKRFLVTSAEALLAADEVEEKDALADLLEAVETLIATRAFAKDSLRRVKQRREDELGGLEQGYVVHAAPDDEG